MTTPDTERARVTQADRDAAAVLALNYSCATDEAWAGIQAIRSGEADEHVFVQAFARHREQALAGGLPPGNYTRETIPPPSPETAAFLTQLKEDAKQIAGDEAGGEWRPIEEAPKDGTPVDLWVSMPHLTTGGMRCVDCRFLDDKWREPTEYDADHNTDLGDDPDEQVWFPDVGYMRAAETEACVATHFMKLPDPPRTLSV